MIFFCFAFFGLLITHTHKVQYTGDNLECERTHSYPQTDEYLLANYDLIQELRDYMNDAQWGMVGDDDPRGALSAGL